MKLISKYLLVVAAVSGFLLLYGGFMYRGGYKVAENKYQAEIIDTYEQQNERLKKLEAIENNIEVKFIQQQEKLEQLKQITTREIVRYVPQIQKVKSSCNVSRGAVRMLDSSVTGKMQKAAGKTLEESQAPSNVTELRLIEWSNRNVNQYNEVMDQCNNLIDFINQSSQLE